MKILFPLLALLLTTPALGQSIWPASKVQFGDADTLEAERDRIRTFAFASLPTCNAAAIGDTFYVNNATDNATCDGGGSATAQCACDGVSAYVAMSGGAGGGAPTTVDYLVGTTDAGLSAEIVVGTTPGGDLGGTWAAPTVTKVIAASGPDIRPITTATCPSGFYIDLDSDDTFDSGNDPPEQCIGGSQLFYATDYASGSDTGGIQEAIDAVAATAEGCGTVQAPWGNTGIDLATTGSPGITIGRCIFLQGYGNAQANFNRAGTRLVFNNAAGATAILFNEDRVGMRDLTIRVTTGTDASTIGIQAQHVTADTILTGFVLERIDIDGNNTDLGIGIQLNAVIVGNLFDVRSRRWDTAMQIKNRTVVAKTNGLMVSGSTFTFSLIGVEYVSSDGISKVSESGLFIGGSIEQNDVGIEFNDSADVTTYGVHFENLPAASLGANVSIVNDDEGMSYVSIGNSYQGTVDAGRDIVRVEAGNNRFHDISIGDAFGQGVNYSGANSTIKISTRAQVGAGSTWTGANIDDENPQFEGATIDNFETTFVITDPTADRNFTIPDADSVAVQPQTCTGTDKYSDLSALGVVTCSTDDDVPDAGDFAAAVDLDLNGEVANDSHTHAAGNITGTDVGTDLTADLEEEAQVGLTAITGNAADDFGLVGSAENAATWSALPAGGTDGCSAAGDKPIYTASTNSWGCGADSSGGAPPADSVGTSELDDGADTPLVGEWVQVAAGAVEFVYRTDAELLSDTGAITSTGVTYENLDTNSDVGFGAAQVPQGSLAAPLASPAFTGAATAEDFAIEEVFDIGTAVALDGTTTPPVDDGAYFLHGSAVLITNFDLGVEGQIIWVRATNGTGQYDCTASSLNCGDTDITQATNDISVWQKNDFLWDLLSYKHVTGDYNSEPHPVFVPDSDPGVDHTALAGGAGIAEDGGVISTASGETDFLASGALTCTTAQQGRMQVHTTALQYCDNDATPMLRYAAFADSAGLITDFTNANDLDAAGNIGLGVVEEAMMSTEDFGDFSCAGAADDCTLDIDVIAAAEMADADHGAVAWSGGVASVEAVNAGIIDNAALAAPQKTLNCDWAVEAPLTGDNGDMQCHIPDAATLVRAYCSTDTGTSNINFFERTEAAPDTGTTGMLTSNLTCATTGANSTTWTDSAVAANANIALGLITPFTTGWVRVSLEYTVD